MLDVALIRAKGGWTVESAPAIGIISIASYISDEYSVEIFDREKNASQDCEEFVIQEIVKQSPRIVGISATSTQFEDAKEIAKIARKLLPQSKIVFGGIHFTSSPDDGLKYGDAVVVGEAETKFKEICSLPDNEIKGIFQGEPLVDLDQIPLPSNEMIISSHYKDNQFLLLTSRGCPFSCTYCLSQDMKLKKVRYHSIDYIIKYLQKINRLLPMIDVIWFVDDVFISKKDRVLEFCEKSKREQLPFRYKFFAHANYVSDLSLFKTMFKHNFINVSIGIESGNDEILKKIKKNTSVKKIKKAVEILKSSGLYVMPSFMIGNISETEKTVMDSINLSNELGLPSSFCFAEPFPGTVFLKEIQENPSVGRIIKEGYHSIITVTFVPKDLTEEMMINLWKKAQNKAYKYRVMYHLLHPRVTLFKMNSKMKSKMKRWT